jgi:site-specific recombinase XerD
MNSVGQTIFAFFEDYLKTQKGLRPGSIRSYRDTLKLFLMHVAATRRRPITRLILEDLSSEQVLDFLRMIETTRKNHASTRNQRLAALHTFYRYLAVHHPEMLAEAERVEAIPSKRTPPPQTHYLERDEIDTLFHTLPKQGVLALRDRALFMVLYNTGARVQEVADLNTDDVDLNGPLRVRLHGKGDKWRSRPLWPETAELLKELMRCSHGNQSGPLFMSRQRKPLTRFGIYKIVKRHTSGLRIHLRDKNCRGISPMSSATPQQLGCWNRAWRLMSSGHGWGTSASILPTATPKSPYGQSKRPLQPVSLL